MLSCVPSGVGRIQHGTSSFVRLCGEKDAVSAPELESQKRQGVEGDACAWCSAAHKASVEGRGGGNDQVVFEAQGTLSTGKGCRPLRFVG